MNIEIFSYLVKFIIGGLIVVTATYLSNIDRPLLAGIAVFFPAITLTSYFIIGYNQGLESVRIVLPATFVALLSYFILLPVMYYSTYYLDIYGFTIVSFLSWILSILILIIIFNRYTKILEPVLNT